MRRARALTCLSPVSLSVFSLVLDLLFDRSHVLEKYGLFCCLRPQSHTALFATTRMVACKYDSSDGERGETAVFAGYENAQEKITDSHFWIF